MGSVAPDRRRRGERAGEDRERGVELGVGDDERGRELDHASLGPAREHEHAGEPALLDQPARARGVVELAGSAARE